MGSSIATVAVLDTTAESSAVITPKATTTRKVLRATPGSDRMRNANRRASPCRSIARARMKAPMNVNTVEEPNGASTSSAGATPRITTAPTPISPPIGKDTGSHTQSTTTPSSTAASVCWGRSRPSGTSSITRVTSGARTKLTVRWPFSNRSSDG